ncbi:MAG: hypothetical protein SVW57_01880 [Thermodesulfobacteriota bacterium]|nr:hypothetical protein [Thermodesulfobacteriota bacterium]
MKKVMVIVVTALIMGIGVAYASIEEHYEEKNIKIQKAGAFEKDKQVKIRMGDKITFKITIYQDEFFGQTTISANAKIDNTTKQKVKAIYSISFHDKGGKLVGCHQGSWDLDPDDDVNYGSGIIYADDKSIASITSYKLRTQVIESKKK